MNKDKQEKIVWKNVSYLFRHRWFVLVACFREGIIWRGLMHDISKFLPSEFFPYARHDFDKERDDTGYYKPTDTGDKAFDFAWLLHQKRNKHHWQWWILPEDNGGVKILEMPDIYVREMICDWRGAGKAQGNKTPPLMWFKKNREKMQLHPATEDKIWYYAVPKNNR